MKYQAITIKDIAKALNLSTSTVSRALRDSHEISSATKQVVMEYAAKLNFQPNPIALSLKERKSHSIGVIVSEIANSFFSQIINGIESVANEKGYTVIISQSHENFEKEIRTLQYLASRSIDGLLISVSSATNDLSHLKGMHQSGMPIVFFDRTVEDITTHKVMVDNYQGAYNATMQLLAEGHHSIACVANSEHLSITKDRVGGYLAALQQHNITVDPALIKYCFHGGMLLTEVETAVHELLQASPRPEAIFATSDKLTTGCMRVLKRAGIAIPQDMALTGFSNSELIELLHAPITVVQQPAYEMGQVATELLLQLIESKRPVKDFKSIALQTRMVQPQ
ncbi:LacI family DNA-binding transcriptional regulator [Chitinophaga sp. Cy-1792]|uniref:LacI family DNA-binding transcriptional regulator n=1 Tax=Chitinophaga sp. Cy-1792 TaxID=2608339 RepID=UPI00141E69D8|nr:LacI family DNA-binding transcriptional regulator [Chitinophaga sp. Cy-1792]NIG55518.1 LacI family transcriptional regulator [Chitinophaga sp. Cy-1792]